MSKLLEKVRNKLIVTLFFPFFKNLGDDKCGTGRLLVDCFDFQIMVFFVLRDVLLVLNKRIFHHKLKSNYSLI